MASEERAERKVPQRCAICGRFYRKRVWKAPDGSVEVVDYVCTAIRSDGEGGWEHD